MRKILVSINTAHDSTEEAIKSITTNLKRSGYLYVDYSEFNDNDNPEPISFPMAVNGVLALAEPEIIDSTGISLPLDNASEDPTT